MQKGKAAAGVAAAGLVAAALGGLGPSAPALAVPVAIAWQVPVNVNERYLLQVAREPGFATLLIDRAVDGNGFTWNTPGEGVFHWRLLRPGKTGRGIEGSTFVSGSFVAINAGERQPPARVSWQAIAGADSYKLYLIDGQGRTRTLISQATSFAVPTLAEAVTVEVVPYSGARRTFRDYHFQPSLRFSPGAASEPTPLPGPVMAAPIVAGRGIVKSPGAVGNLRTWDPAPRPAASPRPPLAAKPAPWPEGVAPASEPAAASAEAVDGAKTDTGASADPAFSAAAAAAAAAASAPVAAEEPIRRRRHLVYGMIFFEEDRLQLTKLEVDLVSRENLFGVGGGFWLNPVSWLVVAGQGAYHEHKGVVTQEERFPGEKLLIEETRYTGTVDVGVNLLAPWANDHHVLTLALTGGAAQLPALPVQLDTAGGALPTFEKQSYNLIGGTLGYGWLSEATALTLDGTVATAKEDEARLAQGRLAVDVYPSERFAILIGGFYRRLQIARCHPDAATCLLEGEVRSEGREAGGFIGLGAVFR